MVHATSHATHPAAHAQMPRLDRNRILAGAGAIALNAGLLMLLLVPVTAPQLLPEPVRPDVILFEKVEPKPVPPLPVPVEPERPRPQPKSSARSRYRRSRSLRPRSSPHSSQCRSTSPPSR